MSAEDPSAEVIDFATARRSRPPAPPAEPPDAEAVQAKRARARAQAMQELTRLNARLRWRNLAPGRSFPPAGGDSAA